MKENYFIVDNLTFFIIHQPSNYQLTPEALQAR